MCNHCNEHIPDLPPCRAWLCRPGGPCGLYHSRKGFSRTRVTGNRGTGCKGKAHFPTYSSPYEHENHSTPRIVCHVAIISHITRRFLVSFNCCLGGLQVMAALSHPTFSKTPSRASTNGVLLHTNISSCCHQLESLDIDVRARTSTTVTTRHGNH